MKKIFKPIVCTLAAFMLAAPLGACNTQINEEGSVPEEEVLPLPETGATTKAPQEEPQLPSEGEQEPEEEQETPAPPAEEKPKTAQYIYIRTDGLNVRRGAGTNFGALGQAEKGTLLQYAGEANGWYETSYKNGKAYVSANSAYTSVVILGRENDEVESVIEEGLRLLGTPYVYGAVRLHDGRGHFLKNFTVSKFDCSSLMQYIFYEGAGVLLDTTTRTQVSQGRAVAKSDIRRGDLLFFTNASRYYNKGNERIGHVALYLGDNYILHTSSDYAKIEQISAQRWSYFITARRMI